MKQGYFVTGTGTGVGKTFVTSALARRARTCGRRVLAYKPIETGCTQNGTGWRGEDQEALRSASTPTELTTHPYHGRLAGYQFALPAAPSVAARTVSQEISISEAAWPVLQALAGQPPLAGFDFVLAEGAGGWRVPITPREDMSALARACGLPVLVVATAALGTINHSLLTIEAIERDGLACAGLVLSQRPEDDRALVGTNLEELRARWSGPIVSLFDDPAVLDVFVT